MAGVTKVLCLPQAPARSFLQAFLVCHTSQLLPASLGSPSQVGELDRWVCKLHPQERASSSPCGFCLVGETFLPAPTPAQECAVFTHSMTVARRGLPSLYLCPSQILVVTKATPIRLCFLPSLPSLGQEASIKRQDALVGRSVVLEPDKQGIHPSSSTSGKSPVALSLDCHMCEMGLKYHPN